MSHQLLVPCAIHKHILLTIQKIVVKCTTFVSQTARVKRAAACYDSMLHALLRGTYVNLTAKMEAEEEVPLCT